MVTVWGPDNPRQKFWKVSSIVAVYVKCTGALTFESFLQRKCADFLTEITKVSSIVALHVLGHWLLRIFFREDPLALLVGPTIFFSLRFFFSFSPNIWEFFTEKIRWLCSQGERYLVPEYRESGLLNLHKTSRVEAMTFPKTESP